MRVAILAVVLIFAALVMQYGAYNVFLGIAVVLLVAVMGICAMMMWYVVCIMEFLSSSQTEVPAGQKEAL